MKKTLVLATIILLCGVASAQQPTKPIAEIKPEVGVKMPTEYVTQIMDKLQAAKKLETDNAQLISAWKDYLAQQNAIQNQINIVAMRAAMKAGMTVEQLDASDLVSDGKNGFQWVPKPKPEAAKADTGKPKSN